MALGQSQWVGTDDERVLSGADARVAGSSLWATNSADSLDTRFGIVWEGGANLLSGTSGLTVNVARHHFLSTKDPVNGPYVGSNKTTTAVTVPAAPSLGSKRVDVLWVRQKDKSALSLPDAVTVAEYGVATGVPGSSPSKPLRGDTTAGFPADATEVGTITWDSTSTVAAATNAAQCTLATTGLYTVPRGHAIPVRSATERDNTLTPFGGLSVLRLDTGVRETYSGADAAWYPRVGSNIAGAGWADNTGTPFNGTRYRRTAEGLCQLSGLLYRTDPSFTSSAGTFYTIGTVPSWMAPTDAAKQFTVWTSVGFALLRVGTDGRVQVGQLGSSALNFVSGSSSVSVEASWWR